MLALRSEKNNGEEERREEEKENGFNRKHDPSPPLNMEVTRLNERGGRTEYRSE